MGTVATTRGQVKDNTAANVVPDSAAVPAAHTDFLKLANALEPKLVLRVASSSVLTTSLTPVQIGMIAITETNPSEVWAYTAKSGGTWEKVWPVIYNGTGVPSAGLGVDNDLYIQY